jgi:2,3-bisphosphoglycerate-dependent phosphoglycerate mutase
MILFFIRHAQSENNALWTTSNYDHGRSEDPELTELGKMQAQNLADFLLTASPSAGTPSDRNDKSGFQLTHIYSSLMIRAVETAAIIAQRLKMPVQALSDVHERGGIYRRDPISGSKECLPGKDLYYYQEKFPQIILPDNFIESGWWDRRPVEDIENCRKRAGSFLQFLKNKHGETPDHVAVISHCAFYNDLLWNICSTGQNPPWFHLVNTGISRIEYLQQGEEDYQVVLTYLNRFDHLQKDLITS